uniref:Zinc transporter ZIP13 n=1 Tax=Paramormyrops kingsleyae TaxID=1676925 RepID=A0A3B3R5D4_9TELE
MKLRAWSPAWGTAVLLSSAALFFISTTASSHQSNARKMSQATVVQAVAGPWSTEELLGLQVLLDLFCGERGDAFICSLIGSIVVGLSGIFPLLVIPIEAGAALKTEAGCQKLKQLLSFAVGGLLGDVFLHLLPEAWAYSCSTDGGHQHHKIQGLWVIVGMLSFLVLEKMFPDEESQDDPSTSGYLNLLANCIDNFTHGLAVGGSFLVSKKVGVLTTFAILLHEIPHEVGDFAILLRAGFDRWRAAKMQLSTALGGVLGACFALCAQSPKGAAWILPFTSGGFLYIALVNIVPDLLQESNPRCSLLQILLLCCGIAVMAVLSTVVD